jgi:hypothetical protein
LARSADAATRTLLTRFTTISIATTSIYAASETISSGEVIDLRLDDADQLPEQIDPCGALIDPCGAAIDHVGALIDSSNRGPRGGFCAVIL